MWCDAMRCANSFLFNHCLIICNNFKFIVMRVFKYNITENLIWYLLQGVSIDWSMRVTLLQCTMFKKVKKNEQFGKFSIEFWIALDEYRPCSAFVIYFDFWTHPDLDLINQLCWYVLPTHIIQDGFSIEAYFPFHTLLSIMNSLHKCLMQKFKLRNQTMHAQEREWYAIEGERWLKIAIELRAMLKCIKFQPQSIPIFKSIYLQFG